MGGGGEGRERGGEGEGRGGRGEGEGRGGKGGRGVGVEGRKGSREERRERKEGRGGEGKGERGEGRERRQIISSWLSKGATSLFAHVVLQVHRTTQACPWFLRPQHTQHT